jgi:hypothetical protein
MIGAAALGEIIQTYAKHGWTLRRVLLTDSLRTSLGDSVDELFGDVKVSDGRLDAAWFSRPSKPGPIAWEIRHLDDTPFALLEYADENAGDFEDKLHEVEDRLRKNVVAKRNA